MPGTELDGTEVGGSRRGVRGLWVELRHRRRHPDTEAETPDEVYTDAAAPAEDVDDDGPLAEVVDLKVAEGCAGTRLRPR